MDIKRNPHADAPEDEQWMLRLDDGGVLYFPTEEEAERTMTIMSEVSGEQVIIEQVDAVLPGLREQLTKVLAVHDLWEVEGINDKIAAAKASGEDIEGRPLAWWVAIGSVFNDLIKFLETPVAGVNQTPKQVMLRRNWREVK